MEIVYTEKAMKDVEFWMKTNNLKIQERISELIFSIENNPFNGIGKPEPLKFNLAGKWSRRIDKENRLIYEVKKETVIVYSLKGHY